MLNYDEPMEFGNGGEEMAKDVLLSDNIVVLCQSSRTDENFWIMLVDKPLHMVTQHLTDAWGQEWLGGDYVMRGLWYKRLHLGNRSYY